MDDRPSLVDRESLRAAMNWVVPPDATPGAGSDAGVDNLLNLIASLDPAIGKEYGRRIGGLAPDDLRNAGDPFVAMFIEHVRDVYYGSPDSGAWSDIGFEVSDS